MYISSRVKTTENYIQCQERADRDTLDDATISTSECEVPRQIAATHFSHTAIQPTLAHGKVDCRNFYSSRGSAG